jgi:excisionase family DNA binding protein
VSKHLINLSRAAEQYDISVKTLRRRIADGSLPAYRVGPRLVRIDPADLDKLERRIPTAGAA